MSRQVLITAADSKEMAFLEKTKRCNGCGHLTAFHNSHCCSFCMVDGCDCGDDGENMDYSEEEPSE